MRLQGDAFSFLATPLMFLYERYKPLIVTELAVCPLAPHLLIHRHICAEPSELTDYLLYSEMIRMFDKFVKIFTRRFKPSNRLIYTLKMLISRGFQGEREVGNAF